MAKKRLLTFSTDGRWRKVVRGKAQYFGRGKSKNDLKSYQQALRRYLDILAQKEKDLTADVPVGTLTIDDAAEAYLRYLHERVESGMDDAGEDMEAVESDDDSVSDEPVEKEEGLSPSSWARSSIIINRFVDHFPEGKLIDSVSALDLDGFRSAVKVMRRKGATTKVFASATVKSHVATVAHFLGWCYRRELLDRLPRNLSEFVSVPLGPPKVKTFSVEELKSLWSSASSRTRLFMALGLNCGFGQSDVCSLTAREWDVNAGIITHKRSKTGVEGKYRLWPITAELLRQHARKVERLDDALLVGKNGSSLVHSCLVDGKLKRTDAVRSAFSRVQTATGINGHRGFYTLRKTAASEIERINPWVTGMFLAHSPREMKKHYAMPHWEALDAAVAEMGRRFELGSWSCGDSRE